MIKHISIFSKVIKPRIISVIFFLCPVAQALECPTDSYPVEFNSSTSGEKHSWCQKNSNGKYLKHGPSQITTPEGKVIMQYFNEGNQVEAPQKLPSPTASTNIVAPAKVETDKKGSIDDIPFSVKQKRPKDFTELKSSAIGSLKMEKSPQTYWEDLRQYELDQLKEIETQINPETNEYAYLFSQIPGMDHESMRKLARYAQTLIPEKMNRVFQEHFEKNPLGIFYQDFIKMAQDGDVDKERMYLEEFKFPATLEIRYLPNMLNTIAYYDRKSSVMLELIAAKKVAMDTVSYCYFYRSYCAKIEDYIDLRCSPLEVAASQGNSVALNYLLKLGLSPNGSGAISASPMAFALLHHQRKEFDVLLNSKGVRIDPLYKEIPCHFVKGNILGQSLAMPSRLDYYQAILAKGFKQSSAQPDPLEAAMELRLFPSGTPFQIKQKTIMERLRAIMAHGFDIAKELKDNQESINFAITNHFYEVVELLMSFNVININRYDEKARSPIFYAFDSVFWNNGIEPKDWRENRKIEDPLKSSARLKTIKYVFDYGGRRQIRDLDGKGMIHYATLELPFSQEILDYLNAKGSY